MIVSELNPGKFRRFLKSLISLDFKVMISKFLWYFRKERKGGILEAGTRTKAPGNDNSKGKCAAVNLQEVREPDGAVDN